MDQFLKILQKSTSDVETFDFARRAGQRRKLEESASHHVEYNYFSIFAMKRCVLKATASFLIHF